ncbi:uncharacterized protein LOC127172206 isoform X2 [Labeo rohita]|uniref:uncharacterized protein LOC127172206 isoform X2 n=1 Tax=Labeo rohita TaxID=84645 RepID=UPI0021E1D488|nr:uncharacterized protein LOC127172206 isoform X2 [Labeo rohita]
MNILDDKGVRKWKCVVEVNFSFKATSNDRDHWDQVSPVNGEKYFSGPDGGVKVPQTGGRTPVRPRWEQNFGRPVFPDPVGPLYPDGREQHAQDPSNSSPFGQQPAFPGQNKGDRRSEQWRKDGKPQRIGRAGRPLYKLDRMPTHPTQDPVDGVRENQMNPVFGKPLSPNMIDNRQFIPIFKADNVTLQGENVFLLPKSKSQMQPPKKAGVNRPQELGYGFSTFGPQPYVKLIFNPNATPRISFEYGITQLLPAFMKAE